jgi:hypothetical protein
MHVRIKRLVSPIPRVYVDAVALARRAREAEERGMVCGGALERVRLEYQLKLLEIALLDGVGVWRVHPAAERAEAPLLEEIPFLPEVPTTDVVLAGHVAFRYRPESNRILLFAGEGRLAPPEEMLTWEEARCLRLRHLAYVIQTEDPAPVREVHAQYLQEVSRLAREQEDVARLCRAFDAELRAMSNGRFDPELHESIAEWDDDRSLLRTGWVDREYRDQLRWLVL